MGDLVEVILPVFLVIGFGYVAVLKGLFNEAGVDGLMRFTQKFAIPCLLFKAISTLDLGKEFDFALMTSFYSGALSGFALGFFGAKFLFRRPVEDCVAIGFCCLFSNSLLLGIPISERAYGTASLATNFAIISIHSPLCYLVGITAMEIARNKSAPGFAMFGSILKSMFSNGLVIGVTLGLVVNLLAIPVPVVLRDAVDMMARAALPAALFGLGGVLLRYRPEGDLRAIAYVVVISLVIHPLITLGMGHWFGLRHEVLRSAVITAAMAPGVNVYVFADMYGRARRVAASAVLVGTAVSALTIWTWLHLLG